MTRAKTHLVMTWRREVQTFFGQGFKFTHPERSRFLDRLVSKKSKKVVKKRRLDNMDIRGRKEMLRNSQARRDMNTYARNGSRTSGSSTSLEQRIQERRAQPQRQERRAQSPMRRQNYGNTESTGRPRRAQKERSLSDGPPPTMMDSTLFFPVGCVVSHGVHGDGKVITPKPISNGGKMMVSVDFQSGMQVDFPVDNAGLIIKSRG